MITDEIQRHRQRVLQHLESCSVSTDFPANDEQVLRWLALLEYRVNLETLHRYLSAGYFQAPVMQSGRRSWTVEDFINFQVALEIRRMWKPFSRFHDPKKTALELRRDHTEASGEQLFDDLNQHSIEDLIRYCVEAEEKHVREASGMALRLKLEELD